MKYLAISALIFLSACMVAHDGNIEDAFKPGIEQNKDIHSLLNSNNNAALENYLGGIQKKFEKGELTEIELRNTYRPFYELNAVEESNLRAWALNAPNSYSSHLALGIFYKRKGAAARGVQYISETSKEAIDEMVRYYNLSEKEFRLSLQLTKKPYLTVFHMLEIACDNGERETLDSLLNMGNEALPSNSLVRLRYEGCLLPRWGGSYEKVDRFIAENEKQGTASATIKMLKAQKYDDMGLTFYEQRNYAAGNEQFRKALILGKEVGGTFSFEFLKFSQEYLCNGPNPSAFCP